MSDNYDEGALDDVDDPTAYVNSADFDHELRSLLTDITHGSDRPGLLPPEALAEIDRAISRGWPEGVPPTAEQIAQEDHADLSAHDPDHAAFDHDAVSGHSSEWNDHGHSESHHPGHDDHHDDHDHGGDH
jgi:hypothetical protein